MPFVCFLVALAGATGCDGSAENDASLFLDRVQRLDLDQPAAQRTEEVDALARLPMTSSEVRDARDVCVQAHRSILEAEELQAHAREAVAAHPDESQISVLERQAIEQDIARSGDALARSRNLFSRCHRRTRDLELRYRSRTH